MTKEKKKIIFPNHFSTSRFEKTALEKNLLYLIIDKLQCIMNKDLHHGFVEQEIKIELKELDQNNNYTRVLKAFSSLSAKQVRFEINVPGTNTIEKNITHLVSSVKHVVHSNYISFFIPSPACQFFCFIGGGFTKLQLCIVLSLNSIYSKSMYELCCRWEDRGGFSATISQLKKYLSIENKYKQIAHLRRKVLDVAQYELERKADFYFTYALTKVNSRKYTNICIKIHKNSTNQEDKYLGVSEEKYSFVYRFLNIMFPNYINDDALQYCEKLVKKGNINRAYYRFVKLDRQYSNGKSKKDIKNLLEFVILPELGVRQHKRKSKSHQHSNGCALDIDLVKRCEKHSQKV